jgi:hypothetical protein
MLETSLYVLCLGLLLISKVMAFLHVLARAANWHILIASFAKFDIFYQAGM